MVGFGTTDGVRADAFTLIELLVVIGIIALLAGILLPALSESKRQVTGVDCMNNMRNVYTAFHVYADDWSALPRYSAATDDVPTVNYYTAALGAVGLGRLISGPQDALAKSLFCTDSNYYTIDSPAVGLQNWGTGKVACFSYRGTRDDYSSIESNLTRLSDIGSKKALIMDTQRVSNSWFCHDFRFANVIFGDGHAKKKTGMSTHPRTGLYADALDWADEDGEDNF